MPLDDELDFVGASSRAQEEVDAGVVVTVDVAVLDSALDVGGGRRGAAEIVIDRGDGPNMRE